jgi:hypothetical protein
VLDHDRTMLKLNGAVEIDHFKPVSYYMSLLGASKKKTTAGQHFASMFDKADEDDALTSSDRASSHGHESDHFRAEDEAGDDESDDSFTEALAEALARDSGSPPDNSSSSTSDSSSSSTSDSSSVATASSSSDSENSREAVCPSGSLASTAGLEGEDSSRPERAHAPRMIRDETFMWKGFRFTYRTTPQSYMVKCPYHTRRGETAKCTRTRSFRSPEERDHVFHVLKAWCVAAVDFDFTSEDGDRRGHQSYDKSGMLLPPLAQLEEADLPAPLGL